MSTFRQLLRPSASARHRARPGAVRDRKPGAEIDRQPPGPLLGPGVLHLRLPAPHTANKLGQWLAQRRLPTSGGGVCLSIALEEHDPSGFIAALSEQLTSPEQSATRALFQPHGQELSHQDYFAMQTLDGLLARQEAAWLLGLLSRQALAMHFQPIVHATPERRLFAYECLMRGRGDDPVAGAALIPPSRMLDVARRAELSDRLDHAAREAALRATAQHGVAAKVFVNFNAAAIFDPRECLRDTIELVEELGLRREQFVFEAVESEVEEDLSHLSALLACFRRAGFAVALDDLSSGYASLHRLERLTPNYIKLDREVIANVDRDPYKATIAAKLLETAQALGIKTVAEGVETAGEFAWTAAHGADFVQGFYVAQPAVPPPQSPWPA